MLKLKRIKVGKACSDPRAVQMVREAKQAVAILEAAQKEVITKKKVTK